MGGVSALPQVDVQRDIKLTKAEKEKEQQAAAAEQLYYSYPLPSNISELKDFAFGGLTWRDIICIGACELIPVVLMLPFGAVIPQWLCALIGALIGLPFSFLSIKHIFTGDLPIEDRVKIAIAERGKSNLLNWDKTKKPDGAYVDSSTQSFVPQLRFVSDKNYFLLPRNQGGFAVLELAVDDITQAKNTDLVGVVNSFKRLLNALIQEEDCTPIQIVLKSVPKNLSGYIETAELHTNEIRMRNRNVEAARAEDYVALLDSLDKEKAFYYRYYIVVTYREDAEEVGNETMMSASNRRKMLQEKAASPLTNKAKLAKEADFAVGISEEERKAMLKEQQRANKFGPLITAKKLERRVMSIEGLCRDLGSSHTAVKPRILTQHDVSKLIYECYNSEDKNVVDAVLDQALIEKDVLYSSQMYKDYPELFALKKKKRDRMLEAQRAGALSSMNKLRNN